VASIFDTRLKML